MLAPTRTGRSQRSTEARARGLRSCERSGILALMATGNEDLVRSSFDAFLRGDWNALAEVLDPGVEWLWHEPGDWDCHDRREVLETLFERQREGVVTGLNAVVAVDECVFVELTGP